MRIIEGAESFLLEGKNNKAVLLLHGYTGAPSEMRPLGDYLHALGYTVSCVRLPGHGTSIKDLEATTATDWYCAAEAECLELLARFDSVYVAGLSMGGLLAIKLAAKLPVQKAAFISAPIFVQDKRAPLLAFLRFFIHYLPKHKKNYQELQEYCISYAKMPTKPLMSLFKMLNECKNKLLAEIKIPCLILQSKTEHTVQPRSAEYIYNKLAAASSRRLVWFEHSGHILTLDREHEAVFKKIADFFAEEKDIEG